MNIISKLLTMFFISVLTGCATHQQAIQHNVSFEGSKYIGTKPVGLAMTDDFTYRGQSPDGFEKGLILEQKVKEKIRESIPLSHIKPESGYYTLKIQIGAFRGESNSIILSLLSAITVYIIPQSSEYERYVNATYLYNGKKIGGFSRVIKKDVLHGLLTEKQYWNEITQDVMELTRDALNEFNKVVYEHESIKN